MKTKLLKIINLILLITIFTFALIYRNFIFHIHGEGLDYENEITFGLVKLLAMKPAGFYRFNILYFTSFYLIFLFIGFIFFYLLEQNSRTKFYFLFFLGAVIMTFSMLYLNFDYESNFVLYPTSNPTSITATFGKSQLNIDMNLLSLATYFYSNLLAILFFFLFSFSLIFKSKIKKQTIEDHLIE